MLFFSFTILAVQRMDLGECPKVHDLALRADYENAAKSKDFYYDIEVSRKLLKNLIFKLILFF